MEERSQSSSAPAGASPGVQPVSTLDNQAAQNPAVVTQTEPQQTPGFAPTPAPAIQESPSLSFSQKMTSYFGGFPYKMVGLGLLVTAILVGSALIAGHISTGRNTNNHINNSVGSSNSAKGSFNAMELPLGQLANGSQLNIQSSHNLVINGQLDVNNSLVLSPNGQPTNAVAGQLYFDQKTDELSYFNGSQFVNLLGSSQSNSALNGSRGIINLGNGLTSSGGQIFNSGVLSLQGQAGQINLGSGLAMNGSTLSVTQSGNVSTGGAGGAAGSLAVFTGGQTLGNSLISQTGATVTVNGGLNVTGNVNLTNPLGVVQGGTGVSSLASDDLVVGGGTGALSTIAASSAGQCLLSTNGAPQWVNCPGGTFSSLDGLAGNLTLADSTGSGSTVTIDTASNTQEGIASFNNTNLIVTTGQVDTVQDINPGSTPTFAGLNTNQISPSSTTLTVGAAGKTTTLQGGLTTMSQTNSGFTTSLGFQTPTANVTYLLQTTAAGTYNVCTTAGNCTGIGGGVTTAGGTINTIPKFTAAQGIGNSELSDSGTVVTDTGGLTVQGTVTLTNALSVGNGGTGANSANVARSNLGAAASGSNSDITSLSGLTTALSVLQGGTGTTSLTANGVLLGNGTGAISSLVAGSSNDCLVSTSGAPVWTTCPDTGVSLLDGLAGSLTIANSTGSGSTVTIQNASTSQLGLAEFNSTNFTVSSGIANTVQNINTAATPTFATLNLTSSQVSNAMLLVNNTNTGTTGNLLDLQLNGSSKLHVDASGNITLNGTVNGQTISSAASLTGSLAVAGAANLNGGATVTGTLTANTITPTAPMTIGSSSQTLTIQGNGSTELTATNGSSTTTLGFQTPTANVTYLLQTAAAGTYNICTTVGNCSGVGGGVTTSGGTTGDLAVFTGSQVIGNSLISESGGTVTVNGNINLTTGNQFQINGSQIASSNLSDSSNLAKLNATQTFTGGSNVFANNSNSSSEFVIQNASNFNLLNVNSSTGVITVGNVTATSGQGVAGAIAFADGTNDNFGLTVESTTLTANQTISFPNLTGTVCLENSTACGFATSSGSGNYVNNTTSTQAANFDVQAALSGTVAGTLEANASGTGDILDLENGSGAKVATFGSSGSAFFQASSDATNAFNIEYAGGSSDSNNVFNVDTIDNYTNSAGALNIVGGETVNSLTSTYVNEPMVVAPKGKLLNQATYSSGGQYVQLNPATNNTWGALQYDSTNPGSYFTATWQMFTGGGTGADSQYFYWGGTTTPINETSATGGYMVSWDEHTNTISLLYNGTSLDSASQTGMNNSTWTNVQVTEAGDVITVYWNGTQEFSYTDSNRGLGGSIMGWGARSGALNNNHRVRNLLVTDNIPTPSITQHGATGSTTYAYEITVQTSMGGQSAPSTATQVTSGPGTLTGTNYNTVSWPAVPGATSYNVYRTVGGTTTGLIGNTTSLSLNDTGLTGTNSVPTTDTSGSLTLNGGPLVVENTSGLTDLAVNNGTGALSLGNVTSATGDGVAGSVIFADGTADGFGMTVDTATLTANQTIAFPNASGTVCLDNSVSCGFAASSGSGSYIQNGTGTQSANFNVQAATSGSIAGVLEANSSGTGDILDLENGSGAKVATFGSSGATTFENSTNSANALLVENASGYNLLNVNSSTGALTLGNITSTSGHGVQGAVAFADGTNDNFGMTIESLTLTNNQTISFPNLSGTVCLEGSAACGFATSSGSGSYVNNTTATQAANFNVQAATSGSVAGVLEANNTGTGDILDLENGSGAKVGTIAYAGATLFQNSTNSANAFEIENAAGYNLLNINSTTGLLSLGNITSTSGQGVAGQISLADGTNDNFGLTVESTTLTANQTISFPNLTGTVCLESSSACGFAPSTGSGNYIQNGTSTQSANFNVQAATSGSVAGVLEANSSGTGDILDLENGSGAKVATFGYNGIVTLQNSTNSTNALQVETSGGSPTTVFNVDTTNDRVGIGTNSPSAVVSINNAGSASQADLNIKAASGQTGDLIDVLDSNGNVLAHTDSNGNYTGIGTITTLGVLHWPTGTSATATSGSGLASSTKYYYEITATNVDGETEGSPSFNATTGAGVNDQITLTWNADNGATGYKIYMNTSNSFTSGSLLLTTISGGSTTSYIDSTTTTSAGTPPTSPPAVNGLCVENYSGSCSFYVNQYGNSDSAAGMTVSGQTGSNNQASNLLVEESGNIAGEVVEGSSTVAAIQIQDAGNGDTLSQFGSNGAYTTYGTNTGLLALATPAFTTAPTGTSFYYVITATNSTGETVQSASLGMSNNTSALAWSVVPGATGYKIYRNSSNNFTSGARLLKTITSGQTTSYTDTGSATTTGLPPTAPNGTTLTLQSWGGQVNPLQTFENSAGTTVGTISATGTALFENSTNSANAFEIENSSGYNILNVNTSTGALTVGNITSASGQGVQGSIILADGTNDNFGLTLDSNTLTANQTIAFPNSSGTVCLIGGTACGFILNQTSQQASSNFNISGTGIAGVLEANTNGQSLYVGDTTNTSVNMSFNGRAFYGYDGQHAVVQSGPGHGINFDVGSGTFGNGTVASISSTGAANFENNTNSATAFVVENSSGYNNLAVNTSTGALTLGNITSTSGQGVQGSAILADGTNDNFGLTLQSTTLTTNQTITFPNLTGTVCLDNSTACGFATSSGSGSYIQNGTSTQSANFNVQAATSGSVAGVLEANSGGTGDILDLENGSGIKVATVGSSGATNFENSTNSTNAFAVENASGDSLLNSDTTGTGNLITNPGFEGGTTGWSAKGSATISQVNTQALFGADSLKISTTAAANDGAEYSVNLASSTTYTLSMYIKSGSGNPTTLELGRSENGSTNTTCATSQDAFSGQWYQDNCTFTTGTTSGSTYIYIDQSDATSRTLYIDNVDLVQSASVPVYEEGHTTFDSNIDVNGSYSQASTTNAAALITAESGGNGLVVLGAPNANVTRNAFDVENNTDTTSYFHVSDTFGDTVVNGGSTFYGTPAFNVNTLAAGAVAEQISGASGQTGNLVNYTDSHNVALSSITSSGGFTSYGANNSLLALTTPALNTPGLAAGGSLTTGTTYYYVMTATNAAGETVASSSVNDTPTTGNDTITLSWTQIPGATGYKVYRNTSNSFTSGSLLLTTITNGATVSYSDTGTATTSGLPPTTPAGTSLTLQSWGGQTANSLAIENSSGSTIAAITAGGNIDTASAFDIMSSATLNIGTANATAINIGNSSANNSTTINGIGVVKTNGSDSTTAFMVENHLGVADLFVDTVNDRTTVGSGSSSGSTFTVNGTSALGDGSSTQEFYVANASSNPVLNVDTTNGIVQIGNASATAGQDVTGILELADGTTDNFGLKVETNTLTGNQTVKFPNASGTVCLNTQNCNFTGTGYIVNNTTTQSGNFNVQAATSGSVTAVLEANSGGTGDILDLKNGSGVQVGMFGSSGQAEFENSTNSLTAFEVENSGGTSILTGDTTNNRVAFGASETAMSTPTGLSVGTATSGGSLAATTTYYYKVTAIDSAGGETAASTEASGATTSSNLTLPVTWTAVTGASGYRVYRATTSGSEVYLTTTLTTGYTDNGNLVAGTAVAPASNTAYTSAALTSNDLQVLVGGMGTPTGQEYVGGNLPTGAIGNYSLGSGASPEGIFVQGNYAYVINNGSSLMDVIDISNPASPSLISQPSIGNNPRYVYVSGQYAYVCNYTSNTVQIFDVANPSNVSSVSTIATGTGTHPVDVYVQGKYAYVVLNTTAQLEVYDVSNPAAPVALGQVSLASSPRYIYVNGNFAYIAGNGGNQIQVVNVATPTSPVVVNSTSTGSNSNPYQVTVQGRYLYVTTTNTNHSNLMTFDISNPTSPVLDSTFAVGAGTTPQAVQVQGRYAYIINNGTNTMQIVDISNPDNPISDGTVSTGSGSGPFDMKVVGRYAYVTNNSTNNLLVYDLGGSYIQQLQAGGAEFGTLQVDANATVAGDQNVQGGLSVGQHLEVNGNVGIAGSTLIQGALNVAGGIQGGATINGLSTPGAPTITQQGTGASTSYSYAVAAVSASGGITPASSVTTTSGGAATLNGTNYNVVSWSPIIGAVSYDVYRTASSGSPSTTGLIGNTSNTYLNDTGLAGGGGSAPTTDSSGELNANGFATFKNTTNSTTSFQVQNQSGVNLLTADTTDSYITIGSSSANTNNILLVLNNNSNTSDPTGTNGAMYYNSGLGQFRCQEQGKWYNCVGESPDLQRQMPIYSSDMIGLNSSQTAPFNPSGQGSGSAAMDTGDETGSHIGVIDFHGGGSAGGGYNLMTDWGAFVLGGGNGFETTIIPHSFSGVEERFGYFDNNANTAISNGAWVDVNSSGVATGMTSKAGTQSSTGTTYTMSTGTWYRVKVQVNSNATQVDFYIYNDSGTQLWHDSLTTNIPTGTTGCGDAAETSTTSSLHIMGDDYEAFWVNEPLTR
ncbi:MAG TPA: hypothetical protein VGS28_04210 [Candidatus Saccharimonadales bacterium]|nr:hypothetical protein [Candidatus Saccharimonadales bacterium]